MESPKKIALYFRVSTTLQSTDLQRDELRRYAAARGFTIYKEYCDEGVSGAKVSRPALDQLMKDARQRRFDVVAVYRFDRMARSTSHLLAVLEEFRSLGIDFVSHNESIDTSTPIGKVMYTVIAAVAEFEKDLIKDRVTSGVRRAIAERKKIGKGWGRQNTDPAVLATILKLRKDGQGCHLIGRAVGLSSRTIWKMLRREEAAPLSLKTAPTA